MNLGRLAPKSLLSLSRRCSNSQALESPGQLVQPGRLGPTGVSDPVGLGRGPNMCICDKFPGGADAAGPGVTLCETVLPLTAGTGGPPATQLSTETFHCSVGLGGALIHPAPNLSGHLRRSNSGSSWICPPRPPAPCARDPILSPLSSPLIPLLWTPSSQPWAEQLQCLGQDTSAGAYMSG